MQAKFLAAPLTLAFLALAGVGLHYGPQWQARFLDGEASASKVSFYGKKDYNIFLATFRLNPEDKTFDVVSLHAEDTVYVFLVNTKKTGGKALYDNMSAPAPASTQLIVPYNTDDEQYKEHLEATVVYLQSKGYAVTLKPYDAFNFRSMVHAGHFDVVLLEKRATV